VAVVEGEKKKQGVAEAKALDRVRDSLKSGTPTLRLSYASRVPSYGPAKNPVAL